MSTPLTAKQRARAAFIGVGMRVIGDIPSASVCLRAAFTGQWEGAEQSRFRNRPGKKTGSQDTDLNFGVRELLISEARNLEQNFPIAKRIRKKYATYCVGKCKIKWKTGDPKIDKLYQTNWENFKVRADANGQHTYPKLTRLAVGGMVGDGDTFAQIIDSGGYTQLRLIEADRVSSDGNYNNDRPDLIGGIGIAPNGRSSFIRVWNRGLYNQYTNAVEIPSADYLHLYDSNRADARRSVTAYHAVLNQLRDFKEGSQAEMTAIKRNSKLALIHKVVTGQAPAVELFEDDGKAAPDSPAGVTMREVNDGVEEYVFPNESIEAHTFNRPGNTWIEFMEFIIRQIAIGVDLPFSVVWHMAGMGKPAILHDLEEADRTFQGVIDEIDWKWHRPIAGIEVSKAIAMGRVPFHPNWHQFIVGRPPSITIDAGRDSQAALAENRMALRSARSWFFETEEDWEEEIEQCVIERKFLETVCEREGVDPSNVRMLTANGNAASTPANPGEGDDGEAKPTEEVDFENLKQEFDSYGVGVRAGVISPIVDDEDYFRKKAGLPPISGAIRSTWNKEPVRRPITITPPAGAKPAGPAPINTGETDREKNA